MNLLQNILLEFDYDIKKAMLIQEILLDNDIATFVEVDSKFIRIEEIGNQHRLTKEKLNELFDINTVFTATISTVIGENNVFYIPIQH